MKSKKRGPDYREQSDSDSDSDSDSSGHNNGRGRTSLVEVRKMIENGEKIPLDWNTAKLPSGEHQNIFVTYIGVIVRERVNLNYSRWKDVPAEVLDEVYADIEKGFTVLPDRRHWIIAHAGKLWRTFKSVLVRRNLYKKSGKIRKKAPSKYPFILQSDWEKFIAYCTTDKFKERSKKNSASVKMRTSHYRGGQKGYQQYQEEIQTANAQAQKDEIKARGQDDIVAKVFKKPEHAGRVKAVGSGITNKESFGPEERLKASPVHNVVKSLQSELAQMTSKQNFMMSFLMEWCQKSTNQATPFTPEQMRQKTSQFIVGISGFGSGQSSGFDGEVEGLDDQSEDAFVETVPLETCYQNTTVPRSLGPKSRVSSVPDPCHHLEPDMGHASETETGHDSETETGDCIPVDCNQDNCTPIDCEQASSKYFVGKPIPPTYTGADIDKVRDLWIDYVFQPKQGNLTC